MSPPRAPASELPSLYLTDVAMLALRVRVEENQYLATPIEIVRRMPETLQELIGYGKAGPALGFLEWGLDPIAGLAANGQSTVEQLEAELEATKRELAMLKSEQSAKL